jgi:cysteine synthase A
MIIMPKIARKLTDLIGNTPLLQLEGFSSELGLPQPIVAKLESFNPGGSVKDRIGYAMIKDGEERGLITRDTVIIEPTSGNTGIALAYVAAARKYRIVIVAPSTLSEERVRLLYALGAEIVFSNGEDGAGGAIRKAEQLAKEIPGAFLPQQFRNKINPWMHKETTGPEIWNDTAGTVGIVVSGVGTGGTISGIGASLKAFNPAIKIVAVEPSASPVLSGGTPSSKGGIPGIGAGFIPEVYDKSVVDEIVQVSASDAVEKSRLLARTEGLLIGTSSGAAAHAASILAKRPESEGKLIVAIFPDTGERYLSTNLYTESYRPE